MKNKAILFLFSVMTLSLVANNNPELNTETNRKDNYKDSTQINLKMIANFNSIELSDDYQSFFDLLNTYNFDEIKDITQQILTENLDMHNRHDIADYIDSSEREELNEITLYSESDLE